MGKAGAGIFDKLEPEPHKNDPAQQNKTNECVNIRKLIFT
jgi:hypothetical protein